MRFTSFRLDEKTARGFRELVFRKHGSLYGTIQFELNRAVQNHILLLMKELEAKK